MLSRIVGSNPTHSASPSPVLQPTPEEIAQRDTVLLNLREHIATNRTIRLPNPGPGPDQGPNDIALMALVFRESAFGGSLGAYRYLFEGEDDLLHLLVVRSDGRELTVDDARPVAQFVLPGVAPALVWLKPGKVSQHFYLGHELFLATEHASETDV